MPHAEPAAQRAAELLAQMTLEEKAAQMTQIPLNLMTDDEADAWARLGAGSFLHTLGEKAAHLSRIASQTRLGIPPLFGIDAVRGYALRNGATVFPCPLALACTWDEALLEEVGRATAEEVAADGLHWTFSPLLCVARDLRWGRVDETFGEAPALIGRLAAGMIRGYQGPDLAAENSILACAKHYLAYGESAGGRDSVDAPIPMRLVREVFLPPFAEAVQAGCATVMTAYHAIDGVPLTVHRELLTRVLKQELGFDGFVVTDWDNVRALVARQHVAADLRQAARMAVQAGNDMLMSTPDAYAELIAAVREGSLPEAALDAATLRILTLKYRMGLFDGKRFPALRPQAFATPAHRALNARAADASLVLLRNEGALPFTGKRIAVVGPAADDARCLLGDWTYLSHPDPNMQAEHLIPPVTPLQGLRALAGAHGFTVAYERGCGIVSDEAIAHPYGTVQNYDGSIDAFIRQQRAPLDEAALRAACENADLVLACVGDFLPQFGEGRDRADLALSGDQLKLLQAVKAMGKPLAVALVSSKPLTVPWVAEHADAVVQVFSGGQETGAALARLLLGETNPSGKLPIAFARHAGQLPVYHNQLPGWHDGHYCDLPAEPLYPFGFGLSYTRYLYADARLSGEGEGLALECSVTNAGARAGVETAQVYAHRPAAGRMTPVKELVAFCRVPLQAGETARLRIPIAQDRLRAVRDDGSRVLEKGVYTLMVGGSSRDGDLLRLHFDV